jgi:cold shock CspA family protein
VFNEPRLGKVTSFDEDRGLGEILADDGDSVSFHCTSITNRQRRIPQGARVTFATAAGHLGELEAVGVTVVTLSADSAGWSVDSGGPLQPSDPTDQTESSAPPDGTPEIQE